MEVLRNGGDRLLGKNCFGQFLIAGRQLGCATRSQRNAASRRAPRMLPSLATKLAASPRASRNNLFSNGVLVSLLVT